MLDFLRRLFGGDSEPPRLPPIPPPSSPSSRQYERRITAEDRDAFPLEIVGESNYQPALKRARAQSDGHSRIVNVSVVREADNPYDGNAVKVVNANGDTIGYLARPEAARYAPVMDRKGMAEIACRALLLGGTRDKPSIGAWLNLPEPERL